MSAAVAQRLLALAAVALLAGVIAVAIVERRTDDANATATPTGAAAPGGGWYSALAASRGVAGDAEHTTCGLILTSKSLGVTHPVADARLGDDQPAQDAIGIDGRQLSPDRGDVDVKVMVLRRVFRPPDRPQEPCATRHAAGVGEQHS